MAVAGLTSPAKSAGIPLQTKQVANLPSLPPSDLVAHCKKTFLTLSPPVTLLPMAGGTLSDATIDADITLAPLSATI